MIFRSWSHIDHVGGTKKQKYMYMINANKNFSTIVCILDDKIKPVIIKPVIIKAQKKLKYL